MNTPSICHVANSVTVDTPHTLITTPFLEDRPLVRVRVRWDDGTQETSLGVALGWTLDAVMVRWCARNEAGGECEAWFDTGDVERLPAQGVFA